MNLSLTKEQQVVAIRAAVALAAAIASGWILYRAKKSTPAGQTKDGKGAAAGSGGASKPKGKEPQWDPAKRKLAREEITSTEESYVRGLGVLVEEFVQPLKAQPGQYGLTAQQVDKMFANIEAIAGLHQRMLKALKENENAAEVLQKHSAFLKIYTSFVQNYPNALRIVQKAGDKLKRFLREKSEQKNLEMLSYLILPVQRIPRYELLLRELLRHTQPAHKEHAQIEEALKQIKTVATEVNEYCREAENTSILFRLQSQLADTKEAKLLPPLLEPHRRLIKEAALQCLVQGASVEPSQPAPCHAFLLTDLLLWTSPSRTRLYGFIRVDGTVAAALRLGEQAAGGNGTGTAAAGEARVEVTGRGLDLQSKDKEAGKQEGPLALILACRTPAEAQDWKYSVERLVDQHR